MGALRPGQMLEGTSYQVVRELGAGGMGVVYEIEHVRLKKRYVAKVIHEEIRNDAGAARRMEREAQVLAGISHPNIVQVHDVGTTPEGISYFVMEKLEGVDLRYTMKRKTVPRLRAVEIITDVLEALAYVHRRGVVHRDIKPENIFLSEQAHGTVTKVLDFGIVHIFDGDGRVSQGRITKTGGFVGTLYYAAPEQMQGKPAAPPNDVYAAGLVLFELLAGRGPFDDDPGVGLSRCFKPAPLLTEIIPRAPRELSDVLAKALEQEPARRPAAGVLAAELRAVGEALRSAPGAVEDDALRAEVDDLLRHMAPIDVSPRPAAGRGGPPSPKNAVDGTAAPATPVMADAPRRVTPIDPKAALEATLASAGEAADDALVAVAPRPVTGPHEHVSTLDVAPQHVSSPSATPQHVSAPSATPQHVSAPSALPITPDLAIEAARIPTGPAPIGESQRSSSTGTPEALPSAAQSVPAPAATPQLPVGATTLPLVPLPPLGDSPPGARGRQGDTSPGLYATVDNQPQSPAPPRRAPLVAIVLAAVLLLLVVAAGGLFTLRRRANSATTGASATAMLTATRPAPAMSGDDGVVEPVSTATATPTTAAAAPPAASATTSSTATTTARATAPASPPIPRTTTASPTTKPAPPAPPRAASTPKGVEKDGYVKDL